MNVLRAEHPSHSSIEKERLLATNKATIVCKHQMQKSAVDFLRGNVGFAVAATAGALLGAEDCEETREMVRAAEVVDGALRQHLPESREQSRHLPEEFAVAKYCSA